MTTTMLTTKEQREVPVPVTTINQGFRNGNKCCLVGHGDNDDDQSAMK